MLTLFISQKLLSEDSIQPILKLLKLTPTPDTSRFRDNPDEEEKSFYYFFFDVLIENSAACAFDIDWKWEPYDIFWQLEERLPEYNIKLIESEHLSGNLYRVKYQCGDHSKALLVNTDHPDLLLDTIANDITDKTFIAINFLEDRYSWLVVPKDFDLKQFRKLTGLLAEPPKIKREALPYNFAEDYKPTEKLFFRPTIIYVDENQVGYVLSNQAWAGRILPGQTIKEGIATELQEELEYAGRFDYSYDGFEGLVKDREGKAIKRYKLTLYLFDKTFRSKRAGAK